MGYYLSFTKEIMREKVSSLIPMHDMTGTVLNEISQRQKEETAWIRLSEIPNMAKFTEPKSGMLGVCG